MSAIFVKMPPQIRRAEAPSDSPMAKPMKAAPATSRGMKTRMMSIMMSSTQTSRTPMLMPAVSGMSSSFMGLPSREAKAMRALASVFMRMPNQATP